MDQYKIMWNDWNW